MSIDSRPWSKPRGKADVIRRLSAIRYGADLDEVERDLINLIRACPGAPDAEKGPDDTGVTERRSGASQSTPRTPEQAPESNDEAEVFGRRRRRSADESQETKGGSS